MEIIRRILALVKRRPDEATPQDPWDVECDPALWPSATDNWHWTASPEGVEP